MTTPPALALLPLVALAACDPNTPAPAAPAAILPAGFFLDAPPAAATPLEHAKKIANVGDTVAVTGVIGGSPAPFVARSAVATLVGPGLPPCSDGCVQPWDFCCEPRDDLAAHSAIIQVVDAAGTPLPLDLKGLHGLKELSRVAVVGTVARIDGPDMVINATGMFVTP